MNTFSMKMHSVQCVLSFYVFYDKRNCFNKYNNLEFRTFLKKKISVLHALMTIYYLKGLTDSVNFMSDKCDKFTKQIQDVTSYLKEMRE